MKQQITASNLTFSTDILIDRDCRGWGAEALMPILEAEIFKSRYFNLGGQRADSRPSAEQRQYGGIWKPNVLYEFGKL